MKNTIGIDFGTTKTLVSFWNEKRVIPEIATLGFGGTRADIPTVVHMDKFGVLTFGDVAEALSETDPKGYLPRIKRYLGTEKSPRSLNGHTRSTVQLVTAFLEYVKHRMEEEVLDRMIDKAVITVPAMYGKVAREQLQGAALMAGFAKVELIKEPEAAGVAYLAEKTADDEIERLLVFDWGGGTLDLAVLERSGDGFEADSELIDGDRALGGEDIDTLLVDILDKQIAASGITI